MRKKLFEDGPTGTYILIHGGGFSRRGGGGVLVDINKLQREHWQVTSGQVLLTYMKQFQSRR